MAKTTVFFSSGPTSSSQKRAASHLAPGPVKKLPPSIADLSIFLEEEANSTTNRSGALVGLIKPEGRAWGVGSVVVGSGFLGRPNFQPRGPKTLILKGFGTIWGKNLGRQTQIQHHGSNAPRPSDKVVRGQFVNRLLFLA